MARKTLADQMADIELEARELSGHAFDDLALHGNWEDSIEGVIPARADVDQERDTAEEAYNAAFCDPCGASPCTWDGVTADGFHKDAPGAYDTRSREPGYLY